MIGTGRLGSDPFTTLIDCWLAELPCDHPTVHSHLRDAVKGWL